MDYYFEAEIKNSLLPSRTFLKELRRHLVRQHIGCTKTTDVTGSATTVAGGVSSRGAVGGGVAFTDISTHSWNPFNISVSVVGNNGKYNGRITLTEMAKFNKVKNNTHFELCNYHLSGFVNYESSSSLLFIMFLMGIYLGFAVSQGFWIGLGITIALPFLYSIFAMKRGSKNLNIAMAKIDVSLNKFIEYVEKHREETMAQAEAES